MTLALVVVASITPGGVGFAQRQPEFRLGFEALADRIPTVVGEPVEDEHYGPNGDSLQKTTTGLMVWRKVDNWTAFTNGVRTWIEGPTGTIWERGNEERFEWEGDYARRFVLTPQEVPAGLVPDQARTGVLTNEGAASNFGNTSQTLDLFNNTGRISGYRAYYAKSGVAVLGGPAYVDSVASVYKTPEGAHLSLLAIKAGSERAGWSSVGAGQVGDESAVLSISRQEDFAGGQVDWITYMVIFRKGSISGSLTMTGTAGSLSPDDAVSLALSMAGRI